MNYDKLQNEHKMRRENYDKVIAKAQKEGNKYIMELPIFAPTQVLVYEGVSFILSTNHLPTADLIEKIYKEDGYILCCFTIPNSENKANNSVEYLDHACVCKIKHLDKTNVGVRADTIGVMPAKVLRTHNKDFFNYAQVELLEYKNEIPTTEQIENVQLAKEFFDIIRTDMKDSPIDMAMLKEVINETQDLNILVNVMIPFVVKDFEDIVFFYRELNGEARLDRLISIFNRTMKKNFVANSISKKVQERLEKNQREMILREQLRAINDELDGEIDDIEKLKEKALAKKMPQEIEKYVLNEIARLKKMPFGSPEMGYIRNFLDTILELPFQEKTEDNIDIQKAREILDKNHYGLNEVKERIVEYLAVLKNTNKLSGQILCFVGPPGIGKTSIVKSIAEALNRSFVQMSLGGISDESLIRGHSRTYVGSRAGRIIMGMKNAKTINPVFLLDEVDKLTRDFRGDPASALLEVLDPEQNAHFKDNFMEVEYDLSQVLFVATANDKSTIPAPLLDRMEVVELTAYTEDEKMEIAKRHLIPRQLECCGLTNQNVEITDNALISIITNYCVEAGVRELERKIAQIFRKIVVKMQDKNQKFIIDESNLQEYLGAKVMPLLHIYQGGNIGEAVGLAWTPIGGTALLIEVALSSGTGKLKFTGKLGDVFKESVELAMSVVKTKAEQYGIDVEVFKNTDVHIHLPEMAIGKEGPSAGITLVTALMSAFTKRATKPHFVMTGEISLLGRVLPIGGLKEKMLAGIKVGATDIIIPEANKSDYEKNKDLVEGKLTVHFVSNIDEVLNLVLQPIKK